MGGQKRRKLGKAGTLSLNRLADSITTVAGVLYKVMKEADAPNEVGTTLEFPGSFWDEGAPGLACRTVPLPACISVFAFFVNLTFACTCELTSACTCELACACTCT